MIHAPVRKRVETLRVWRTAAAPRFGEDGVALHVELGQGAAFGARQHGLVDEVRRLLDEGLRGAGHGPDHRYMLKTMRLVVSRATDRPGYAYIDERGSYSFADLAEVEKGRKDLERAVRAWCDWKAGS